jgi:outer membrane protein TolC
MGSIRKPLIMLLAGLMALPSGCLWQGSRTFEDCAPPGAYERIASEIEYPVESTCTLMNADESIDSPPPRTIDTVETAEYWDVSLEEVIQLALANSKVMRDLGGAVVRAPATTRTTLDPAIAETDPRFGIEAALSDFDAQFLTSTYWEKNDRALNNEFFGGGTRLLQQDVGVFQAAITKRAATGSRFTIRHNVDYDANNAPGNVFPSAWNANVEMEIRHPFLQGSGTQYNRIAGLDSTPGVYDGVLIARLNADVALTDFEIAVRDLVSNVENAYWDLYFGYRVLEAKVRARNEALDIWRNIHARFEVGRAGGEAHNEAQAREQYFRFQQDVENALSGEPYDSTRNWNGLPSGAFRATGGVLMAERRLRLLMGLPPSGHVGAVGECGASVNDLACSSNVLLRPSDEPVLAKIDFDWCQVTQEATTRRAELRRQKWQVRRRELELMASKNHLLPRLDGVGRYRWRGFGDDLFPHKEPPLPRFDNAFSDLVSGDFQEWQLGFELSMPIGFRQAHVAARNADLLLARERAILKDQQREVVHEAADAIAEMDRAYTVLQTSYNRLDAGRDQLKSVEAIYAKGEGEVPLDLLLDAQRRLTDIEVEYVLNRARYSLATKNVHFVKGTLLEYDGVFLAEGPWPGEAYHDSAKREKSRSVPVPLNYASSRAPSVSRGPYAQHVLEGHPSGDMSSGPVFEEELPLAPPGITPREGEPIPEPADLPMPSGGAATPTPMAVAVPGLAQPNSIQAGNPVGGSRPQSEPSPFGRGQGEGVIVAGGTTASPGGTVPAIHFQSDPAAASQKPSRVSTNARRLPPTVVR